MKKLTLDDLMADLQDAKELARANGNANAIITATLAQAKLLGLDTGKPTPTTPQPISVIVDVEDCRKRD